MILSQIRLLTDFYWRPTSAASAVLDAGQPVLITILAILTALAFSIPAGRAADQVAQSQQVQAGPHADDDAPPPPVWTTLPDLLATRAVASFGMLAGLFVPLSIGIVALATRRAAITTLVRREYGSTFTVLAYAWVAAHWPFALISAVTEVWWAKPAAYVCFVVLAILALQPVFQLTAVTATGAAIGAAVCAQPLALVVGSIGWFWMLSPYLLFYFYGTFSGTARATFDGLRNRQSFRRHLEASTLNPHDADAHYQLGLIYHDRRNLIDAEARFRRACEIDRQDADYQFNLGRVLRELGRTDEARSAFDRAAQIDKKVGNHEVWRELGALDLAARQLEQAKQELAYYVEHREYDPEGLFLLGEALRQSGDRELARTNYQRAIEAVNTAPTYRRYDLRVWEKKARAALAETA